ncbi:MAG: beta galactosidase jelly roll domain-containing protein [Prevotellaceae bacterium]|nr:beta galactosidase jelly roll domain-containing protein [Prevotellaceae bacterium]
MKKKPAILLLSLFAAICAFGQVRLPQLVSDNMILQRDVPVKLWGWAAPGEAVSLTLKKTVKETVKETIYRAVADSSGSWLVVLPPQPAGGPYTIDIRASNSIAVSNVLFGDVWLCSGQSNMETPVERVMTLFGDEVNRYSNPSIRYVKIPMTYNFHAPQPDVPPCSWVDVTPETAQHFSAVAYFFAREMYEKTKVPVGIINSSVGGSPAEAWIGEEALQPFPALLNDMRICRSDEFVADMQRLGALPDRRWSEVLNEQDKGMNEAVKWFAPDYDDRAWPTTDLLDSSWGRNGFHPNNGVFWFRREVDLPAGAELREAMLYMGRIVGADEVYVNGELAGTTGYQYPPRNYPLRQGLLKAGKNVIAVRLISRAGFPEFVKDKPYKIVSGGREVILEGAWKYQNGARMNAVSGGGITFQYKPAGLYNAMVAPLQNFAVKGVLWYQGEANTGRHDEYYELMSALIGDWRRLWDNDSLPFFVVQLPNFMEPALLQQNSGWASLREVQRKLAQAIPNTALTVTIDLGEWNDIHPLNKKDVGKRIALQARRLAYGENIVSEGPVYLSHKTDGSKVILSFEEKNGSLLPTVELKGFAVAGADGIFHPAKAAISGKEVVVWSDSVALPAAVRYAWANNPAGANLYNTEGLPASPFQLELSD